MTMINRRALLASAGAGLFAPFAPPVAFAQDLRAGRADALVFVLSDLHSAYRRLPATLGAIDTIQANHPRVPTLTVINGDLFERANLIARRSEGEADFAFLQALARRSPTVVNLGNHETALQDDLAAVVARIQRAGATVVTSIAIKGATQALASGRAEMTVANRRFTVGGIGTDDLATYRETVRDKLAIPKPFAAAASLKEAFERSETPILLSHAGVTEDRTLLPAVPDGVLMIGGHDHLRFAHRAGSTLYLHVGAYQRALTVVAVSGRGARRSYEAIEIEADRDAVDDGLAQIIERLTAQNTDETERAEVASLARALPLGDAARLLARAMAAAGGGAVGLINHTTLGGDLPLGVTTHDLMNFIRFDGPLFRAEIAAEDLAPILDATNQDGDIPLSRRTGDFLYADAGPLIAGRRYGVITNGWVKQNAKRYLGREDFDFAEVPERRLRAIFEQALKG